VRCCSRHPAASETGSAADRAGGSFDGDAVTAQQRATWVRVAALAAVMLLSFTAASLAVHAAVMVLSALSSLIAAALLGWRLGGIWPDNDTPSARRR